MRLKSREDDVYSDEDDSFFEAGERTLSTNWGNVTTSLGISMGRC
jgi:hypothetical protein